MIFIFDFGVFVIFDLFIDDCFLFFLLNLREFFSFVFDLFFRFGVLFRLELLIFLVFIFDRFCFLRFCCLMCFCCWNMVCRFCCFSVSFGWILLLLEGGFFRFLFICVLRLWFFFIIWWFSFCLFRVVFLLEVFFLLFKLFLWFLELDGFADDDFGFLLFDFGL